MQSFLRPSHSYGLHAQSPVPTVNFSASLQKANQTGNRERYAKPVLQAASQHATRCISTIIFITRTPIISQYVLYVTAKPQHLS